MAGAALNNIVEMYGVAQVVHGIDAEVHEEKFADLAGASGCGKSTMLCMFTGLDEISGGVFMIGGSVVSRVGSDDRDVAVAPFVSGTETLDQFSPLGRVKGFTTPKDLIKVFDASTGMALSGLTCAE